MPAELVTGQDAETSPPTSPPSPACRASSRRSSRRRQLFAEKCGICHALRRPGRPRHVGPDLDQALAGKDAAFVEESIVDPENEIAQGFSAGIMPGDFGTTLTPDDLKGLVDYLLKSVGGGGSSGG